MKEPDSAPADDLIFPWNTGTRSLWRLLLPLLVCLALLGIVAVVFKVAEPSPARGGPVSRSILLLDPGYPANQGVLNRALDRGVLLLGQEDAAEAPRDRALMPLFEPSFAGFDLRLKDPVAGPAVPPRYRLFQSDDLALPPMPAAPPARLPPAAPPSHKLEAVFHGDLAERRIIAPPALDHLRPRDLARLRFELGVQANGRVFVIIPLTASLEDRDLVPALQSALGQARFAPEPGGGVIWGETSFNWARAAASP